MSARRSPFLLHRTYPFIEIAGGAVVGPTGDGILLETGDFMLLETDDYTLIEAALFALVTSGGLSVTHLGDPVSTLLT